MHKVVILIEPLEDQQAFEIGWPQFLEQVEEMPGLRREASSHTDIHLAGAHYPVMHELFFDSSQDAQNGLTSPPGQLAGRLLQRLTGGRFTLFIASTAEDTLENIRMYKGDAQGGQA